MTMENIIYDFEKGLNRCFFAVSKMYVCTTNESCPLLQSRSGTNVKRSEVGLIKQLFYGKGK